MFQIFYYALHETKKPDILPDTLPDNSYETIEKYLFSDSPIMQGSFMDFL